MIDFHSHFVNSNSIVNSDLLLPSNYRPENEKMVLKSDVWHIGEIGLDKRYAHLIPMDEQVKILSSLLDWAKNKGCSVSLHCVQSTQIMIDVLRKAQMPELKVLWHGFNQSAEIAKILADLGVIISIGPRFNKDLVKIVKANPYYVFESDYTGNSKEEYEKIFNGVISKACKEMNLSLSELEEHCESIEKIFKN